MWARCWEALPDGWAQHSGSRPSGHSPQTFECSASHCGCQCQGISPWWCHLLTQESGSERHHWNMHALVYQAKVRAGSQSAKKWLQSRRLKRNKPGLKKANLSFLAISGVRSSKGQVSAQRVVTPHLTILSCHSSNLQKVAARHVQSDRLTRPVTCKLEKMCFHDHIPLYRHI